jgi:hypothetical protein
MTDETDNMKTAGESNPAAPKKRPGRAFRFTLCSLGLLLIVLVLASIFARSSNVITNGHWILAAISGRMFLVCAAMMVGSLMALLVLSRVLWVIGAANRRKKAIADRGQDARETRGRDALATRGQDARVTRGQDALATSEGGAVIVEFAMVLPFVLMFIAMMVQSMLLMAGYLCVHYSAFCAARAAIVQVPAYVASSNEDRNYINPGSSTKVGRIKASAVWALIPISCGSDDYPVTANCSDLQSGLTSYFQSFNQGVPNWINTQLPRRLSYAQDKTTMTISPPASGGLYGEHEDIVVHVEHTFYLSIPYMAKLFKSFGHGVDLDFGGGNYGLPIPAECRLPNEGVQDYVDEEKFDGFDSGGAVNVTP